MMSVAPGFLVLNDASTNIAYNYSDSGTLQGSFALAAENATPRGATSLVGVEKTWIVDANRNVYIYDRVSGMLLGSWSAGSMPNNATPEGIATDGKNIWIVDSRSDKVYRFDDAASRLSGSQNAASSFGGVGSNPKDIVSDGVHLWIVEDGSKVDRVYKYHVTNGYWGSWVIDSVNKTPTGITIDPQMIGDIWISDSGTDRVYRYSAATPVTGGSLAASSSFVLASGNSNPQGLVIPGRHWEGTSYAVAWVRQLGSSGDDWGRGTVVSDGGDIYLSGTLVPSTDTPFLAKYDSLGNQVWLHQQTPWPDANVQGVRIETDRLGNLFQVYCVTSGSAASRLNSYDPDGNLRWSTPLPVGESTFDVAVDAAGFAFTSSYEGNNVHIRQYDGQSGAVMRHIVVDAGGGTNSSGIDVDAFGNIYVTAYTSGAILGTNAGSYDGLVMKFSSEFDSIWTRQYGSAGADYAFAAEADRFGSFYSAGRTHGSLNTANAGGTDTFMAKHDAAGNLLWTQQWGASGDDGSSNIWIDPDGAIYRSFPTLGTVAGPHLGGQDIVVAKHDPAGNLLWATQLGTSGDDVPSGGMWGDGQGNIYLGARTTGSWGAANAGGFDAVLLKLTPTSIGTTAKSSDLTQTYGGLRVEGTDAPSSTITINAIHSQGTTIGRGSDTNLRLNEEFRDQAFASYSRECSCLFGGTRLVQEGYDDMQFVVRKKAFHWGTTLYPVTASEIAGGVKLKRHLHDASRFESSR